MFFYVGKVAWGIFQPSSLVLLALLGGWWMSRRDEGHARTRRVGRWLTGLGFAIWLGAMSPASNWLILLLENRFERADLNARAVTGVVVLGGGEDAPVALARHAHALNEAGERISETVGLARRLPSARIVFSGGTGALLPGLATEAVAVQGMLTDMGVAAERITIEDRSRDTWENAAFTKAIVQPKPGERWLLVTTGAHMPRSIGVFRAVGFPVEAWPVDYRTTGSREAFLALQSPADGLRRLDFIGKEYAGLIVYWLRGRTSALFPGP